jgi:hypothetical protein
MRERNLRLIPAANGRPAYYVSEITIGYRRLRRFAGYTKPEARDYLRALRAAASKGELESFLRPKEKERGVSFGDYARSLLDSAEWKQKRSARRDECSLKRLNREFKDLPLTEISPAAVREYMTERSQKQEAAPATVNRELSLLKSILNSAVYDGILGASPIQGRRVRKLEENNSRERAILGMNIGEEKLRELIRSAAPGIRPIVMIAVELGMRNPIEALTRLPQFSPYNQADQRLRGDFRAPLIPEYHEVF